MMDPKVVLLMVILAGGYFGYTEVVKPVSVKVAHVTKAAGAKVGHGLKWIVAKAVGK